MREMISEDIQWINKLVASHFGGAPIREIERLGGLTNHSYSVLMQDGKYVFRLPGEGTEQLINRHDEKVSTELACDLQVDAKLVFFDEDKGVKISEYVEQAETMSPEKMREHRQLVDAARLFHTLHTCAKDTKVRFEVFEMAEGYEKFIAQNGVSFYEDYRQVRADVMALKKKVDGLCAQKVPCHNDPLCENWVRGTERLYLIDWEYAGMNDPMWDLADLSIEAEYTAEMDADLLAAYFDRSPETDEVLRFQANKIFLDFLWSLWGKTRVPFDGEEMEQYARDRYERMKKYLQTIKI